MLTSNPSPSTVRAFIPLFTGLLLSTTPARSEEKAKPIPVPFPGLTTQVLPEGVGAITQQISYDAALSQLINKPLEGAEAEGVVRLLATRIDRGNQIRYLIDFDPGPSADPAFVITDEKTKQLVGRIGADALVVPGNGFIYALGRSNNLNLERQKFAIREGKLEEVRQPFSYVGLDTKAKVELTLTAEKSSGGVIAKLPAGDALQVVLRDGEHLLIKTPFGLIGWWKMKTDVMAENAEIEGIYYAGD